MATGNEGPYPGRDPTWTYFWILKKITFQMNNWQEDVSETFQIEK